MLDIWTLLLTLCLTTGLNGALVWWYHRKTAVPGTGWWAVGTACVSAGLLLVILRGHVGLFLGVPFANALILIGYAVVWDGMRRYAGRSFSLPVFMVSAVIVAVCFAANIWWTHYEPSLVIRSAFISLGILTFSFAISNSLLSGNYGRKAVFYTGAGYSINAVINGVRLAAPVVVAGTSFMNAGTFTALYLLFSVLFSIGVTVGQIFMIREESSRPTTEPMQI